MKSATIAIPDDLDAKLEEVARERNTTSAEVIHLALRKYLAEIQENPNSTDEDDFRPIWMPVLPEKDDRGESDVSINHDHYLAEDLYQRKLPRT